MKFQNPFFSTILNTTKVATRKATHTFQLHAVAAVRQVLNQAFSGAALKPAPIKDINPPPQIPAETAIAKTAAAEAEATRTFSGNAAAVPANAAVQAQAEAVVPKAAQTDIDIDIDADAGVPPISPNGFSTVADTYADLFRVLSGTKLSDLPGFARFGDDTSVAEAPPETASGKGLPGEFVVCSLTNAAGTRPYKLYIPAGYTGQPMPLLVMLHGCTQDPDDFAAGTRMNALAEEQGYFVVYPAQIKSANGHKCWNWFSAIDQQRDQGEASIIADITRAVLADYQCDPQRVFVAGLSAGGAMAVIMGDRYPELYSAVGVHSGLPYAAAQDVSSALAAMREGVSEVQQSNRGAGAPLPVIVFHGDRDTTVNPRNGEQIIEQVLERVPAGVAATKRSEGGTGHGGRAYTRTIFDEQSGRTQAELWTVHGTAHAWSGGAPDGSYTDIDGPDASAEMLRFFDSEAAR